MKLGIITDVHEHTHQLEMALEALRCARVDQIISLGDFCENGQNLAATCQLLLDADVVGVWGNHDYGLCIDALEGEIENRPSHVQEFARNMRPTISLADCFFSHIEPWLDPNRLEDLWYLGVAPESSERIERIFAGGDWRIAFAGHYHQWLAVSQHGPLAWKGDCELDLSDGRYLIIIDAVMRGCCATFSTDSCILTPIKL